MADYTIAQLPQAASVHADQLFEVSDNGASRHVTLQQIYLALKAMFDNDYQPIQSGTPPVPPYPPSPPPVPGGKPHIDLDTEGQLPYSRLSGAPGLTAIGLQLMTAASAAAARQIIGAGVSSLTLGYGSHQAKPGNWTPHIHSNTTGKLPVDRVDSGWSSGGDP